MRKKFLIPLSIVVMITSLDAVPPCRCQNREGFVKQNINSFIDQVKSRCPEQVIAFVQEHKTRIMVAGCVLACVWYAYKNGFFSSAEKAEK